MKWKKILLLSMIVTLALSVSLPALAARLTRTEELSIPASGISSIRFGDLTFTNLSYKGIDGADTFSIKFERKVQAGGEEKAEELLARISLDTETSGGIVTVMLIHPKANTGGLFNRVFDREEWDVILTVTGPKKLDININADFSDIRTESTSGTLHLNSSFTESVLRDHSGKLEADVQFGSIRTERLDGAFDVDGSFSSASIRLANLSGESRANVSFGDINIVVPEGTGAEFQTDKSMGGVKFRTRGQLTNEGYKGSRRILNNGGPLVRLGADFGGITVSDRQSQSYSQSNTVNESNENFPLKRNAWWKYSSDGDDLTLRVVKTWRRSGRNYATLEFDKSGLSPFERIDVCESDDGLCVAGLSGRFYDWDTGGKLNFGPPKLWLPYGDATETDGGDILGTVRSRSIPGSITTPAGQISGIMAYTTTYKNSSASDLKFSPGVGFVSFGDFQLSSYDIGVAPKRETEPKPVKPPEPKFEKGIVKSIKIRNERYLSKDDILKLLDIKEGELYTMDEIREAVSDLKNKHKFISHANFSIDIEGNLTVRIFNARLHKRDWDLDASFDRIGGLGIGPEVTITSLIGPISKVVGSTQYHFANKEWTYNVLAEKRFFEKNQLAFGGTYRNQYESSMSWAIPRREAHFNALILGLETEHYHQVEGATGFVSFSLGKKVLIQADYFEEKFNSVKKHTNWSIFNHRHVKDDNTPLALIDEGRLVGMRLRLKSSFQTTFTTSYLVLEAEQALDRGHNSIGDYQRLFGNIVNTWRLSSDNYLKIRLAGGYSEDALPAFKSFNLGGLNTLRGFDYNSFPNEFPFPFQYGGNRMTLCNVEYFMGEDDDFGLILFADAGGVWVRNQDFDASDIKRDIGIGININSDFMSFGEDVFSTEDDDIDGLRVNWAVPVGNESHVSKWSVNFVRAF